jgi:hypothetical protein
MNFAYKSFIKDEFITSEIFTAKLASNQTSHATDFTYIYPTNKDSRYRIRKIRNEELKGQNEKFLKTTSKLANTHFLRILFLSLSCLSELLECVNYHVIYINSTKIFQKEKINNNNKVSFEHSNYFVEDYMFKEFLDEFLNFDELKQCFPLLMRFYSYNPHIYSNTLIRTILVTNKIFLSTYKQVFQINSELNSREQENDLELSTNATKNSSNISNLNMKSLSLNRIYDLYTNPDTSFILRHVLLRFTNNDNILNKCCIDLLDTLMNESQRCDRLFHMDLTLALASIAKMDNFMSLDQRTKDVITNILCQIRRLCKKRPYKANKIVFEVHHTKETFNKIKSFSYPPKKRIKVEKETRTSEKLNDSDHYIDSDSISRSLQSSISSSWSSLRSTTSISASPSNSLQSGTGNKTSQFYDFKNFRLMSSGSNNLLNKAQEKQKGTIYEINNEMKLIIENEFLFCMRSLDAFTKTNSDENDNSKKMCTFIMKNDHLYRILNYLVELFETTSNGSFKLTSWQIFMCLLNMKFDMKDKINYLNELNYSKLTGKNFSLGLNLSFGTCKNDFFKSNECINLRIACNTLEFRRQLKEAYIKYLIDKLCLKSKRTKNAIFWLFNIFKNVKFYLIQKTLIPEIDYYNEFETSDLTNFLLLTSVKPSKFSIKLMNYYCLYQLGFPCIPFTIELV